MASFLVPQKLDYITEGFDRTTLRWYNFERLALNDIHYVRDSQAKTGPGPSISVLVLRQGHDRKN